MAPTAQVLDMAERKSPDKKSRRKSAPKEDDAEPTGFRKMVENPVIILVFVIVLVILLLAGIWGLAAFLSGG